MTTDDAGPRTAEATETSAAEIEFRVLGPLEVLRGGNPVPIGGARQRLVLAHLLINANQLLPATRLIEEVWGTSPPEAARNTAASYVSHLRRSLGDRIRSRPPGYVLEAAPEELDAERFVEALQEARRSLQANPGKAAVRLREALSLWNGEPFADLAGEPSLQPEVVRLQELRLGATEDLFEAELALGRHADLVADLEKLTQEHPRRERLWILLVLALHRAGRQGEAAAAFRRAREALARELDVEPSPELQRLYERILEQEAGPARATAGRSMALPETLVATGHPADVPGGREAECEAVERFLGRLQEGPATLLLVGEPGIGKTTVWEWGRAAAVDRGHLVLSSRPSESEMPLAFAGLSDLLEPVLDLVLPDLLAPQRRALEVALLRAEPEATPLDRRAISVALLTCMRSLARRGSTLLAIDDAQWLDRPTASALEFGLRRLTGEPVGLLAASRPVADRLALETGPERERLVIGPLSLDALRQLIQSRLSRTWSHSVLARIHQATGGNPFYALEMAAALAASPTAPPSTGPLPVPRSLHELVASRIARLPELTRKVLRSAAALSHPTVELVRAAHPSASVETELDRAERAGVVEVRDGRIRFTHPILASAVYAEAPAPELRRLHRTLAGLTSDPEERAGHLARAADRPDEAVAAPLQEAAWSAAGRGAPATAAQLVDLAFRLTPPDRTEARLARGVELGEHLFAAAQLDEAAAWLQGILGELGSGSLRARALWILGAAHEETDIEAAIRTFGQALDATDDPILLARTHLALNYLVGVDEAIRHCEAALELLGDNAVPELRAEALAAVARTRSAAGLLVDRSILRRAVELEDTSGRPPRVQESAHLTLSLIAAREDDFDTARAELVALKERAMREGDDYSLNVVAYRLGQLEFWGGDLGAAAQLAAEAMRAAEGPEPPIGQANPLSLRALVMGMEGRFAEAEQSAERALEIGLASHDEWYESAATWTLGFVSFCRGDAAAAGRSYSRGEDMLERLGLRGITFTYPIGDHVETLIALGDLDRARVLLDRLEERAAASPGRWATGVAGRSRALLAAARGDLEAGVQSLSASIDLQARLPMPAELGRSLLAMGGLQRRAKRKRSARDALERALGIFEGMGATAWAGRARAELDRVTPKAARPLDLTDAEQLVARLAAMGKTNHELAAELFMSVRTAEAHLSRVYRKLGIRSRAQLGQALDERR